MVIKHKPLAWIGSSHKDLCALPKSVVKLFGFALSLAQAGERHTAAKVLKGFGGAGVLVVPVAVPLAGGVAGVSGTQTLFSPPMALPVCRS